MNIPFATWQAVMGVCLKTGQPKTHIMTIASAPFQIANCIFQGAPSTQFKLKNLICILISLLISIIGFPFFPFSSSSSTLIRPSVYDGLWWYAMCQTIPPPHIVKTCLFPSFATFIVSSHCDTACSTCLMSFSIRFDNSQCQLHALASLVTANWNLN